MRRTLGLRRPVWVPACAGMTFEGRGRSDPTRHSRAGGHLATLLSCSPSSMLHEWEVAVSKRPCVYILASDRNGTLYIGVTSDLEGRVSTHLQDLLGGFTAKHRVHRLVYYEMHESMDAAILREKRLKKWNRLWKLRLIESANPEWLDLFDQKHGAILDLPADVGRRRS